MTEISDAAMNFEAIKYAYRQNKDGVVVSFVVHPNDVPPELSTAHIGARYMAVLVELGDDEKPKSKMDWRELQPAAQAGIRCAEVRFRDFLAVERGFNTKDAEEAAVVVRQICGVESRSQLSIKHKARTLWHQLDTQYRQWAHL